MTDWMIQLQKIGEELGVQADREREARQAEYPNASYNIVAIVGYLIGVPKRFFDDAANLAMNPDTYRRLDRDSRCRIIRNLCMVRSALEMNYRPLVTAFTQEYKNIDTVPDLVPVDALKQLAEDGITIRRNRPQINEYIIEINKHIKSRISNCKNIFPDWLNWEYIKELFIMPGGTKVESVLEEGRFYKSDVNRYPYQCYINWSVENCGNILFCDEKFVTVLYEFHEDCFEDMSLVRHASDSMTGELDTFLKNHQKTIVAVDCENANPIKVAAMFMSLTEEQKKRIHKVLLFDSHYSAAGWGEVSAAQSQGKPGNEPTGTGAQAKAAASGSRKPAANPLTDWSGMGRVEGLTCEHLVQERLLEAKSQVDMQLVVRVSAEVLAEEVDAVILVASDCDYSALIDSLMFGGHRNAKFLCMVESGKVSPAFRRYMEKKWIPCLFIDDYCTGLSYSIKTDAIRGIIQHRLDQQILNVEELLDEAVRSSYLEMTEKEKKTFMDKYIRKAHIEIDREGNLRVVLGQKGTD